MGLKASRERIHVLTQLKGDERLEEREREIERRREKRNRKRDIQGNAIIHTYTEREREERERERERLVPLLRHDSNN